MDLTNFPPEKTRNFSIIAHIGTVFFLFFSDWLVRSRENYVKYKVIGIDRQEPKYFSEKKTWNIIPDFL